MFSDWKKQSKQFADLCRRLGQGHLGAIETACQAAYKAGERACRKKVEAVVDMEILAEREACAKVCDMAYRGVSVHPMLLRAAACLARLMRERKNINQPQTAGMRKLKVPSARAVPSWADNVTISLTTHCPQKWAIVDMETGQLWGHDGQRFRLLSPDEAQDVAHVVGQVADA